MRWTVEQLIYNSNFLIDRKVSYTFSSILQYNSTFIEQICSFLKMDVMIIRIINNTVSLIIKYSGKLDTQGRQLQNFIQYAVWLCNRRDDILR